MGALPRDTWPAHDKVPDKERSQPTTIFTRLAWYVRRVIHSIRHWIFHSFTGQFWNIPISYTPYDGELPDYLDALKEKLHIVTVEPENGSPVRNFLAEEFSRTWENRQDTCFYAGNGQAGRSGMVAAADDSVIEGNYSDYLMSSIFEDDFVYSQFEGSQC